MDISDDKAIAGLDLEPIKLKLMRGKPGAAWSRERVEAAEKEYRRFLFLMKMFPNELTAPSMDVDRFWHHHIVETAKYARDCEAVFGYFLHRYPYLGLEGEDPARRLQAGARMRELRREVFGAQAEGLDDGEQATTGFAMAVQSVQHAQAPRHTWTAAAGAEALLDHLRFVVIENQRYDRMAEPVM
jgi:hypothetical protein